MARKTYFWFSVVLFLVPILYFLKFVLAETIVLDSGKKIEGKIIEKTDKTVEIKSKGENLTYNLDEIDSVREEVTLTGKLQMSPPTEKIIAYLYLKDLGIIKSILLMKDYPSDSIAICQGAFDNVKLEESLNGKTVKIKGYLESLKCCAKRQVCGYCLTSVSSIAKAE
jgi:hypothetical protein